jgi:hypothetical protein
MSKNPDPLFFFFFCRVLAVTMATADPPDLL